MSAKSDKRRLRVKGDGRLRELAALVTAWGTRGMSKEQAFAMAEAQDNQLNEPPLDDAEFKAAFKDAWAVVSAQAKEEYFQNLH